MTRADIAIFQSRLKAIGVDVVLFSNAPWVYMDSVNGKPARGTYMPDHHFTAFFYTDRGTMITDIGVVFSKIRETLNR